MGDGPHPGLLPLASFWEALRGHLHRGAGPGGTGGSLCYSGQVVGLSCPIGDHPRRVEADRAPEAGGLPSLPALGLLAQTEGRVVSRGDLDLNSILFSELQDESPT